jgi:L-methionine (R)-S-oxide reductase
MSDLDETTQRWLEQFLRDQGAVAGTVHALVRETDTLVMQAAVNIPEKVREVTFNIPRGKGMAGLALEREQPVSSCNLQAERSADVRPGAKAVNAQAAVALPIAGPGGVRAIVGLAYMGEREFSSAELDALTQAASSVPRTSPRTSDRG